jgi:hypothetical protein
MELIIQQVWALGVRFLDSNISYYFCNNCVQCVTFVIYLIQAFPLTELMASWKKCGVDIY